MVHDKTTRKRSILDFLLLAIIAILPIIIFYTILHFSGPQWDIIVRYLEGRTFVNFLTHNIPVRNAFVGEFQNNLLYYFEPYREPLAIPIFALLSLFFGKSVLPYIIVVYAGFLLALYELSKELKIDKLIMFSVFVNSYVIYFFFVLNGGEALSLIFALLGFVYLLRKRAISGAFFGIAAIAKYPSILLLPLVLLLDGKRKKIEALVLGLIPIFIWGGIDYLLYNVPFYSYFESLSAAGTFSGASAISLISIAKVFAYPILFIAIGIVFFLINKEKLKIKFDYTAKVFAAFVAIAAVCYFIVIPHNDPSTQARYGYLLATALFIIAAPIINSASKKAKRAWIKYFVAVIAIVILAYAAYSTYIYNNNPAVIYYSAGNTNSIYVHAGSELASLGYGNCRFVSNAWVLMIYSGYDAYSPFILYSSNTISPVVQKITDTTGISSNNVNSVSQIYRPHNSTLNYTTYLNEEREYPIVVLKYTGVPSSLIVNLNSSRLVYQDQNISIYLPENASCYRY